MRHWSQIHDRMHVAGNVTFSAPSEFDIIEPLHNNNLDLLRIYSESHLIPCDMQQLRTSAMRNGIQRVVHRMHGIWHVAWLISLQDFCKHYACINTMHPTHNTDSSDLTDTAFFRKGDFAQHKFVHFLFLKIIRIFSILCYFFLFSFRFSMYFLIVRAIDGDRIECENVRSQ